MISQPDEIFRRWKMGLIAGLSVLMITLHVAFRFVFSDNAKLIDFPLVVALALGGVPLVYDLLKKLVGREFGSDLLAGISIVTSILLGEYLAGTIVILMLAGGETLESYTVRHASSVLRLLANRMPSIAHRKRESDIIDVTLDEISVGDTLVVYPHDICPVDGTVLHGNGVMNMNGCVEMA